MKKTKTAMNYTNDFKKVFRAGYCDLQYIMRGTEPQFYNCGVYGWNCDLYVFFGRDMVITTGYRNMRGERIPAELIEKYSENVKNIIAKGFTYKDYAKDIESNLQSFLDELEAL